ncbi:hypothetical protein OIU79_024212 [Salix purpurea]|uniref:Uncharacterized protein n=1 Tax=Salix purpurea TaxID=77065 RepID=A0A9Q0WAD2_SALPP|nr:hypothetical protein OIU79_024212 [Salix purpurea]
MESKKHLSPEAKFKGVPLKFLVNTSRNVAKPTRTPFIWFYNSHYSIAIKECTQRSKKIK